MRGAQACWHLVPAITAASASTATTSPTAALPPISARRGTGGQAFKLRRHHLPRSMHHLLDLLGNLAIATQQHCNCPTSHSRAAGASDTMNVVLSIVWSIKVDDHANGLHIQPSCCNIRCHQYARRARLESIERLITLALISVSVNCLTSNTRSAKCPGERITHSLGASKDDHLPWRRSENVAQMMLLLPLVIAYDDLLLDVSICLELVGASNAYLYGIDKELRS
mmetsp:Transcript_48490/g.113502  ORF Transcript_48490/g.113502 Transcript_48490/m.113502 type:complete len:225 (+) Transcript_48490:68-742(+)